MSKSRKFNPSVFEYFYLEVFYTDIEPNTFSYGDYETALSFFNMFKRRKKVYKLALYGVYPEYWQDDALLKTYVLG